MVSIKIHCPKCNGDTVIAIDGMCSTHKGGNTSRAGSGGGINLCDANGGGAPANWDPRNRMCIQLFSPENEDASKNDHETQDEQPHKMLVKVGKLYKTRSGRRAFIYYYDPTHAYLYSILGKKNTFECDLYGYYIDENSIYRVVHEESENDLIEECKD